eukprot:10475-Heterococcus_DN1.PRE.3
MAFFCFELAQLKLHQTSSGTSISTIGSTAKPWNTPSSTIVTVKLYSNYAALDIVYRHRAQRRHQCMRSTSSRFCLVKQCRTPVQSSAMRLSALSA